MVAPAIFTNRAASPNAPQRFHVCFTHTDVALSFMHFDREVCKAEMFGNRWVLFSRHVIHPSAGEHRRGSTLYTHMPCFPLHMGSTPRRLFESKQVSAQRKPVDPTRDLQAEREMSRKTRLETILMPHARATLKRHRRQAGQAPESVP